MSNNEQIDATFKALGWTYSKHEERFRDRDGNYVFHGDVVDALPPGATEKDLEDYEYWKDPW